MDEKHDTLIAYFDFAKAFDRVSIPKLLFKLNQIGIAGSLFSCIRSLLSNRMQCVKIDNAVSSMQIVTRGVPQGSVLGPILFIIFIKEEITDILPPELKAKFYADDLKSYMSCTDTNSANMIFQNSLDAISVWCNDWQFFMSTSKSGWMLVSNKHTISEDTNFLLGGCVLQKLSEVKDLGLYMDNKLHFSRQITAVVSKGETETIFVEEVLCGLQH